MHPKKSSITLFYSPIFEGDLALPRFFSVGRNNERVQSGTHSSFSLDDRFSIGMGRN